MLRRMIALAGALIMFNGCAAARAELAEPVYPFCEEGVYYLVDESGRALPEMECGYIQTAISPDGHTRYIAYLMGDNGAQLMDEYGQQLTDVEYDNIYEESGTLIAMRGDNMGIIDWDGTEILPPKYRRIVPVGEGVYFTSTDNPWDDIADEIYLTGADGICTYININASYMGCFSEERMSARARNGKYGYLDTDGHWVVAPIYDWAEDFSGGKAVVRRGDSFGMIDIYGNVILPLKYDSIVNFSSGEASSTIVAIADGTATLYDSATLMPLRTVRGVEYAYLPGFGTAALVGKDGVELYDARGKAIMHAEGVSMLEVLSEDRLLTIDSDERRVRLTGLDGTEIFALDGVSEAYSLAGRDGTWAICAGKSGGGRTLWGLYDMQGSQLLPMEYDEISSTGADTYVVKRGDDYGLMRSGGEWIFPVGARNIKSAD